jgi:hypoxanthine-DNA glycosylase
MSRVQSFPPIVSERSKLIILGSMPREASLKAGQYYAHLRNAFWPITRELFGVGPSLPYQERVAILQSVGVALSNSLQFRDWKKQAKLKDDDADAGAGVIQDEGAEVDFSRLEADHREGVVEAFGFDLLDFCL